MEKVDPNGTTYQRRRVCPSFAAFASRAVILLLATTFAGCGGPSVKADRLVFSLPDLEGRIVSSSDERFQGKVLLVDVWGTWCPPCHKQIPYLAKLHDDYHEDGLEIVGIDFEMYELGTEQDRREEIKAFAKEFGINYLVLLGGEVGDLAGALPSLQNFTGFPTSIYIGRDGRVRKLTTGFSAGEAKRIEKYVEKLLREQAGAGT